MSLRLALAWGLVAAASSTAATAAPPEAAAAAAPPPIVTFEDLLAVQARASAAGDSQTADRALREIRRLRVERNIDSHDTVGLALVMRGLAKLEARDREGAEQIFRSAVGVAPRLPDSHLALARSLLRRGPLGLASGIGEATFGLAAFFRSGLGALRLQRAATVGWLLLSFLLCWSVAASLLVRCGGLLRHDLEEWLGPAQNPAAALALFLAILLLPVATFQGWGWLPLWWLAVLYVYCNRRERLVAALLLASALGVGPAVESLDRALSTAGNPLYAAALSAIESCPDATAIERLAAAARRDPQDRDLAYLLAAAKKRSGQYEQAAELYRSMLGAARDDAYARNNLANIEFARGAFDLALTRYRAGTGEDASAAVMATSYYNLSLAHLQKFEYQAFNEAKASADRIAPGLISSYERWKYDTGDYAVVDLGLTRDQLWTKFAGASDGVAVANVTSGGRAAPGAAGGRWLNRFSASIGVFLVVAFLVSRWRGAKAFTLHCARCGLVFCRYCHLGQAGGGLCSQCYHLFVVRDGVSAPARNRKLSEVQKEDGRRDRVFRILSVLSPGAGHVYAERTLSGLALMLGWYGVIAAAVAARLAPITDVPRGLTPLWPWFAGGVALILIWLAANRSRPATEIQLPSRPPGPRRAKTAQGA